MIHGYAKGCRCDECREKHRLTQMKYRTGVRVNRRNDAQKRITGYIVDAGVAESNAVAIAKTIMREFVDGGRP